MKLALLQNCTAFALLLLGASCAASPGGPEYGTPLDIGALSGGQHLSLAYGINNSGLVCGLSHTSDLSTRAFVYTVAGGLQDLGTLPGGTFSEADAVNDAGQVVGDADTASGQDHLFVWHSAHGMQDLGSPAGSYSVLAAGVNASGQICGSFEKGTGYFSGHAFIYSGGAFHDLGIPGGYVSSQATGINSSGTVCGYVADSVGNTAAFVHSGTGPLTSADLLPSPQTGAQAQANGINNAGQVVGTLNEPNGNAVGFVYSGGTTRVVTAGALMGVNNVGVAVGEINSSAAGGFLYNIAAQATQAGPAVCDYPVALNDHNDSVGSQPVMMGNASVQHASLDAADIGALPGSSDSVATALNASGQVAGSSSTGNAGTHVVLRDGAGLHDINAALLAAGQASGAVTPRRAYAINASGQIAGFTTRIHAFLYDAAHGAQDLGALSASGTSIAYGLNDAGQVVGVSDVTPDAQHAFSYTAAGGMKDLGTLPGGTYSAARAINNAGQVVGQSDQAGGAYHAFYTAAGGMKDLGTLPGGTISQASAVSASGSVAGFSDLTGGETHAFLYTAAGGMQDLGTLPGGTNSVATGLNASGQVVGYADAAGGQRTAFVWDLAHGMRDLNALLTPGAGFTLTRANAINDKGQITGYGVNALGQTHGFILTPISHSHILWTNPDGRATLWFVNPDNSYGLVGAYGPYVDGGGVWKAAAVATGPNGVSRILWTNPDGRATLWFVNPDGTFGLSGAYGPYVDGGGVWRAGAVSVGPDNVAHILWTNPDGRATLWYVNTDNSYGLVGAYGPYADAGGVWKAGALATGPNGVSRLLWANPDGRATLWYVNPGGAYGVTGAYGPYVDGGGTWRAGAVSVGPDAVAHILWTNPDGRATLWFVNPDNSYGLIGAYGPYADGGLWAAGALATGPDGISHILWANPDGRATLWYVNPGGAYGLLGAYGPYSDSGGLWRAVADSAGP